MEAVLCTCLQTLKQQLCSLERQWEPLSSPTMLLYGVVIRSALPALQSHVLCPERQVLGKQGWLENTEI